MYLYFCNFSILGVEEDEIFSQVEEKPTDWIHNEMHDVKLSTKGLLNTKVISRTKVKVKTEGDKNLPRVSGCVFIDDGSLILCDSGNNKLKLLDNRFDIKEILQLSAEPWDIAVVNETTVTVTLLNANKLQFVQVVPSLENKETIKLPTMCWGVEVVADEIFVNCNNDDGEGQIKVLNMDGTENRVIIPNYLDDYKRFKGPYNFAVSRKSGNIFVSDYRGNIETCMTPTGNILYQYEDPQFNGPRGVIVDSEDNLIVCSYRAFNLHVINANGVKHRTLIASEYKPMKPWCVAYRNKDNKLVIGCAGKDLLVIGLEYAQDVQKAK